MPFATDERVINLLSLLLSVPIGSIKGILQSTCIDPVGWRSTPIAETMTRRSMSSLSRHPPARKTKGKININVKCGTLILFIDPFLLCWVFPSSAAALWGDKFWGGSFASRKAPEMRRPVTLLALQEPKAPDKRHRRR